MFDLNIEELIVETDLKSVLEQLELFIKLGMSNAISDLAFEEFQISELEFVAKCDAKQAVIKCQVRKFMYEITLNPLSLKV